MLRHPGYVGGLLALIGLGVIYSNWVGLAGFACSALVIVLWRIHIEETALLRTAGEPYRPLRGPPQETHTPHLVETASRDRPAPDPQETVRARSA